MSKPLNPIYVKRSRDSVFPVRNDNILYKQPFTTDYLATFWGQKPGGNWYWRLEVPARKLPGHVLALAFSDLKMSSNGIVMPRQQGDTAVWAYPGQTTRGVLMAAQKAGGYRVLIEVDDNYLLGGPHVPGGQVNWVRKREQTNTDRPSFETHRHLAEVMDGVIVATEELAEAYREVSDHVYVCPNSVDPDDWDEPEKPDDGIFRIGYAASHSHWYDANDARLALSWAAEQPNVEIVLYGLDPHWSFPYRHIPWTRDLAQYRRSLQQLDVGVCPLRANPWSICKSDIKAMEYAMAGACAVVADEPPYKPWTQGLTLAAKTPKDFLRHLKFLVLNRDAARDLAANAKSYVLAERTIDRSIHLWREAICG